MIVTNVGRDAVDAAASGAQMRSQGKLWAGERSSSAQTTGESPPKPLDPPKSAFGRRRLAQEGCCVRQNRVVLAPVAGVKLAEIFLTQPGPMNRQSAGDGDKTNSSPGRARHKP